MTIYRRIRQLSALTLLFIYLVIMAGSIVRASGSGMGCPDWPRCFGEWIPPTDVSELPDGYEADFLEKRKAKLDKYISLLESLGFEDIAAEMRADDRLLVAEPFDAIGTWIEYANRLVGFIAGNLMLALFIVSLWLIKRNPLIPLMTFVSLIAIVFQAWLGAVVVASNLTPWIITIHMMVAFLIIALLISVYTLTRGKKVVWKECRALLALAIGLTLIQVVVGTQVRQEIDHLQDLLVHRSEWIDSLSSTFELHRSFSILLLLVNGYLAYHFWNRGRNWRLLAGFVLLEVMVGVILSYFDLPRVTQPLHLLMATLIFGLQWYLWSEKKEGKIEAVSSIESAMAALSAPQDVSSSSHKEKFR